MKKLFYLFAVTFATLSACMKEPAVDSGSAGGDRAIKFVGETFDGATKTSIGGKVGSTYPVLWSAGDKIGIISTVDESDFPNLPATLFSEDAGKSSGIFILENYIEVTKRMDLLVYYPYSLYTSYSGGVINANIPMEQQQAHPGDNSHTGKYTLAYAKTYIDPAEAANGEAPTVNFSLTHAAAYVKFVISSTEFSSYKLCGVSLWSEGEAISGNMSVNPTSGAVTNKETRNYATVTVEDPQTLSSAQEVWLVTLPVDLTGKDAYVSVSMNDGTKNVTIPVKVALKQLKANAVNTVTIANVSTSDNQLAWYQPIETRYLAAGWTYGVANTFIATTDGEEIVIDLKARGYLNGAEEPKYANIIWGTNFNEADNPLLVNGQTGNNTFIDISPDYTMTVKINATATSTPGSNTTVPGLPGGWFGKIGLCNANQQFIWAFTVWYVPNRLPDHQYTSGVVMDRQLGNAYPSDYPAAQGFGAYYQWGRPFPSAWHAHTYANTPTNVIDLRTMARSPNAHFSTNDVVNTGGDWWLGNWTGARTDRKDDFWGNPNTSAQLGSPETGTKSIFDPCPKGYMVASPAVLKEVREGGEFAEFGGASNNAVRAVAYKYNGTDEALWRFTAFRNGTNATNGSGSNANLIMAYWSNSPYQGYSAYDHSAYQMFYNYNNSLWVEGGVRANGQSIRCMKDDANR